MLPEVSVDTFLPVAVATGTATFIGRIFFGSEPAFSVPVDLAALPNAPSGVAILLLYALLGAIVGVAAAGFVRTLHWLEDGFDLIRGRYLRHGLGILIVGMAMYAFWLAKGHYFIAWVGYATIQATLHGGLRHVVVTRAGKIIGGLRVNVSIRRAVGGSDVVRLGDLASRNFIIVAEEDAAFDVIKALTQARATMAIVIARTTEDEPNKVVGVITKEHIADTVSRSVQLYPG